jgi:hypothetical protein
MRIFSHFQMISFKLIHSSEFSSTLDDFKRDQLDFIFRWDCVRVKRRPRMLNYSWTWGFFLTLLKALQTDIKAGFKLESFSLICLMLRIITNEWLSETYKLNKNRGNFSSFLSRVLIKIKLKSKWPKFSFTQKVNKTMTLIYD